MGSHLYDYKVDLYSDSTAAYVVQMVGRQKRVLDLGAGPGSISRVLVDSMECQVTAVDIDPTCIGRLKSFCDHVLLVDLNRNNWVDDVAPFGPFDVVVAADVLEHLLKPESVLRSLIPLLQSSGFVVVSLPNIGFCGVLNELLNAEFHYRRTGLLDRSHIRFFGIRDMERLFQNAGFYVEMAKFKFAHPESTEFALGWRGAPRERRKWLLSQKIGRIYQVVVRLVPEQRLGPRVDLWHAAVEAAERQGLSMKGRWRFFRRVSRLFRRFFRVSSG